MPVIIYIQNPDLIEDMPEWAKTDPILQSLFYALDIQFREVIACIPENVMIPVIRQLNYSELVDLLAYQFHVDFYDPLDTLERRRNLVADSIIWHRKKGTVGLVQEVLDYWYPGGATLEEWFDYMAPFPPNYPVDDPGGLGTWHDRYRFRVTIDQVVIPPADEAQAMKIIERYKPISRWPEAFYRVKQSKLEYIYWAGGSLVWQRIVSEAPTYVQPFITRLNPPQSSFGIPLTLEVIGEDFQPTSLINFDFVQIPTTYISATLLRSATPFNVGTLGDKTVYVETPGMADSNILIFKVTDVVDPQLVQCVPPYALENDVLDFKVQGHNFQAGSVIEFDGTQLATTFVDANNLEATNPLDVGLKRTVEVRVLTNPGALVSNSVWFVVSALPVLIQLIPDTAPELTKSALTCIGTDFAGSSKIVFDGVEIPTTWISSTEVRAVVPFAVGAVRDVNVLIRDLRQLHPLRSHQRQPSNHKER